MYTNRRERGDAIIYPREEISYHMSTSMIGKIDHNVIVVSVELLFPHLTGLEKWWCDGTYMTPAGGGQTQYRPNSRSSIITLLVVVISM
jgi:hypothetical protein